MNGVTCFDFRGRKQPTLVYAGCQIWGMGSTWKKLHPDSWFHTADISYTTDIGIPVSIRHIPQGPPLPNGGELRLPRLGFQGHLEFIVFHIEQ
jgi:hypothetical protein